MTLTRWNCVRFLVMAGLFIFVTGCGKTLETQYATPLGESINGASGFIELVKSQGHRTQLWRSVSPRIKHEFDVLVMFHNSYEKIPKETMTPGEGENEDDSPANPLPKLPSLSPDALR